jgi:hypothetical protein
VSYELIERAALVGAPMYALLDELVEKYHEDLRCARIALAWCTSWKRDVDGRLILGKCKRASDLDRELSIFDFIILLNRGFWTHPSVNDLQKRALLDHELHHAAVKYDDAGEPVEDERGRRVYRIRKHDVEEFATVVQRYGTYKADLELFAKALRSAGVPEYQPCADCQDSPGWVYVEDLVGRKAAVTRCRCFLEWQQARELASA